MKAPEGSNWEARQINQNIQKWNQMKQVQHDAEGKSVCPTPLSQLSLYLGGTRVQAVTAHEQQRRWEVVFH